MHSKKVTRINLPKLNNAQSKFDNRRNKSGARVNTDPQGIKRYAELTLKKEEVANLSAPELRGIEQFRRGELAKQLNWIRKSGKTFLPDKKPIALTVQEKKNKLKKILIYTNLKFKHMQLN